MKPIFQKTYTRDTTLIMQQLWFETLTNSLVKEIGINKPPSPVGVDYIFEGAIEVWENIAALKFIKQELVKKSHQDPLFLIHYLEDYEKNIKFLWKNTNITTKKELLIFIRRIHELMPGDAILTSLVEEEKAEHSVRALCQKLRAQDHFFASNDEIIRKCLQNIFSKYGELIICLKLEEINSKIPLIPECKKRFQIFVVASDGFSKVESLTEYAQRKKFIFINEEEKEKRTEISKQKKKGIQIVGQVAFPGIIRGKVKILRRIAEMNKVKTGDIIVSPMTTPALLPALKRAAAIITDEGGSLCHAAIVARELKIPCIVGTKIATKVLKDDDLVEVDANKGIVRKVEDTKSPLPDIKNMRWRHWLERPYPPFMPSLCWKGVDAIYFEKVGLPGFGYNTNLYQFPNAYQSDVRAEKNRLILTEFFKKENIFTITKLLEKVHEHNKKYLKQLNKEKDSIKKLKQAGELICLYFPFLWITDVLESYYKQKTTELVPKYIKDDVQKWVGDISIPKKKNQYVLMQEALRKEPIEKVQKKYAWLKSRDGFTDFYTIDELREIKKHINKSKSPPIHIPKQLKSLAVELQELTYLRTDRTDKFYEMLGLCRPIFEEVAASLGISFKELGNYDAQSILQGSPRKITPPYNYLYHNREQYFSVKKFIDIESNETTEIRGTPAFSGKVRGVVKIVKHPNDISKVEIGDILVAQMTLPSFISAMNKAVAFVTDEGGITCHAAIIAREMKKPCVIGTKIATKVLKDGDRVEVDANKGIVTKIP